MDICSIKEAPVKTMHQYIKEATVLRHTPSFWSRKQRRQTQSLRSNTNQPRRRKVRGRIQKVARSRRSACICYVSEKA